MIRTPQRSQLSASDAHTSTSLIPPTPPTIFTLTSPVPNTGALTLSSHFQALPAKEQANTANEAQISLHATCNRDDLVAPRSPEAIDASRRKVDDLAFACYTVLLARRGSLARPDTATFPPPTPAYCIVCRVRH
jgi:hypothetical protein